MNDYIDNVVKKLKINEILFEELSICEQVNDKIAMEGINQNGINLMYLAQKQQSDKRFALTAIKNNPFAYSYLTFSLERDTDIFDAILNHEFTAKDKYIFLEEIELLKTLYYKRKLKDEVMIQRIINCTKNVFKKMYLKKNKSNENVDELIKRKVYSFLNDDWMNNQCHVRELYNSSTLD